MSDIEEHSELPSSSASHADEEHEADVDEEGPNEQLAKNLADCLSYVLAICSM
jgi:hypothetical protein